VGQNATITGDVVVLGTLRVQGNFALNADPASCVDDPQTSNNDESRPETHGIFIYKNPLGGGGTLDIANNATRIWGDSGRIHCFVSHPGITDATRANALFCNLRNTTTNTCSHWYLTGKIWIPRGTVAGRP
jgi:hypothetical protein